MRWIRFPTKSLPDAVLETENSRFMIEVERSTKTLQVVMTKIEHYCQVFSRFATRAEIPACDAKYNDKLPAVCVDYVSTLLADQTFLEWERAAVQESWHMDGADSLYTTPNV